MDLKKIYGDVPNSYYKNEFPDIYSRYRFYSTKKMPLSLRTQKLNPSINCSECGTLILNNKDLFEDAITNEPLCSMCDNGGFKLEYFNKLSPKEQKIILKNSKRKIKTFISFFLWGFLGVPLFFGGILGGALTSNFLLLGLSIPFSLILMFGMPFLFAYFYKKKEKDMKKQILPIIHKYKKGEGILQNNEKIGFFPSSNKNSLIPSHSSMDSSKLALEDKNLLEKFKKILKISSKIRIEDVSNMLDLSQKDLLKKLLDWGDILPFKIDNDTLVVENVDFFISELDRQFDEWKNKEDSKIGKN